MEKERKTWMRIMVRPKTSIVSVALFLFCSSSGALGASQVSRELDYDVTWFVEPRLEAILGKCSLISSHFISVFLYRSGFVTLANWSVKQVG